MPDSDWQLSQSTVDFRNEERYAASGRTHDPVTDPPCPCGATINGEPASIYQCGCTIVTERFAPWSPFAPSSDGESNIRRDEL